MRSTRDWPDIAGFEDHWSWRPDWTPDRPRLLWYLTFPDSPQLLQAAAPLLNRLRPSGADVVPLRWLHLTLTDLGFRDQVDDQCRAAVTDAVREAVRGQPALDLRIGPVTVLPGAVVLAAHPRDRLEELRRRVREATTRAGLLITEDIHSEFWPHVSLCYVNRQTDHEALWAAVHDAEPQDVTIQCDRLVQALVTRHERNYRWQVVEQVPFGVDGSR